MTGAALVLAGGSACVEAYPDVSDSDGAPKADPVVVPPDGDVGDGVAPQGSSVDRSLPQIREVLAPTTVRRGQVFTMRVTTKPPDPERVVGVLVVDSTTEHWYEVPAQLTPLDPRADRDPDYDGLWFTELRLEVAADAEVGHELRLQVALMDLGGRAGGFAEWRARIEDAPALSCPSDAECEGLGCGPDPACSQSCGSCPESTYCSAERSCVALDGPLDQCTSWEGRSATREREEVGDLAVSSSNGLFVTGRGAAVDDFTLRQQLWKWSQDGQLQWSVPLAESNYNFAGIVAADDEGGAYLAHETSLEVGGQTPLGSYDIHVVRYDAQGNERWSRLFGTEQSDLAADIASRDGGPVYVTGVTGGSWGRPVEGANDSFLARIDADGSLAWVRQWGTAGSDTGAQRLAVDRTGDIIVVSRADDGIENAWPQKGSVDLVVAKFAPNGDRRWLRLLGDASNETITGVTTDHDGNIYLAVFVTNGEGPSSLISLDAEGDLRWRRDAIVDASFFVRDVVAAPAPSLEAVPDAPDVALYVLGEYDRGLDGESPLGESDLALLQYNLLGSRGWARLLGGNRSDIARAVDVGSTGRIFVAGEIESLLNPTATIYVDDAYVAEVCPPLPGGSR